MSTQAAQNPETQEKKKNKRRGTLVWLVLILILFLFVFTTVILGSRLYDLATRDQYAVDLGIGTDGELELFRIEYENDAGEITVQGVNGQKVIAPGTNVDYAIRLRNRDDVVIDFTMIPEMEFLTEDPVPVQIKLRDNNGNYLLGGEDVWADIQTLNGFVHKGSIHPGEVFTYYFSWEWVFEVSDEQDAYDTYLGNQTGEVVPGVAVSVTTESTANPVTPKHNRHMMHLLGEGFGCCWCCWLVWILLLVIVVIAFWNWRIRRKLYKQEDTLEEYEQVLQRHGLLVDGKLVGLDDV